MGVEQLFNVRIESQNGVANISLVGELDMATAPALEAQLSEIENDGVSAIMLDLRDLTFLDCSGLHAFVNARDRAAANGHRLIFVGANPPARRLFELTRTQYLLEDGHGVLEEFTRRPSRRAGERAPDLEGTDA